MSRAWSQELSGAEDICTNDMGVINRVLIFAPVQGYTPLHCDITSGGL